MKWKDVIPHSQAAAQQVMDLGVWESEFEYPKCSKKKKKVIILLVEKVEKSSIVWIFSVAFDACDPCD